MSAGSLPFRLAGAQTALSRCEYRVENLLGKTWLFCVYGPEDTGKSSLLVELGYCVVCGVPFFGFIIKERGSVLIIAAEGADATARRAERIATEIGAVAPLAVCAAEINLAHPNSADIVTETIEELERQAGLPCALVLIDGLADTLDGDENSPVDSGLFIRTLREVRRRKPVAVGFIHHSPLSNPARLRGHTKLVAALDLSINVTRKGGVSTARVVKRREGRDKPSFTYKLESVTFTSLSGCEIETSRVMPCAEARAGTDKREKLPRDTITALEVLRHLCAGGDAVSAEAWREATFKAFGDRKQNAKRTAWSKVHRLLTDRGLVDLTGGSVSVSSPSAHRQLQTSANGANASAQIVSVASPEEGAADAADARSSATKKKATRSAAA